MVPTPLEGLGGSSFVRLPGETEVCGDRHELPWFCILWGFWHPGSLQTWSPLSQLPPAGALLHPFGKLYAQQIRLLSFVCNAFPIHGSGTLGPRPLLFLPVFPLPGPLPFGVGLGLLRLGDLERFLGGSAGLG